jgi:hypothetical protein
MIPNTVWVSKDANGNVTGVFANPQSFAVTQTTSDDPAVVAHLNPTPVITVSQRQARLALQAAGLLDKVNAAVNSADVPTQITWNYASCISSNDPLIATVGAKLGLTSQQVAALFVQAQSL